MMKQEPVGIFGHGLSLTWIETTVLLAVVVSALVLLFASARVVLLELRADTRRKQVTLALAVLMSLLAAAALVASVSL
jgi:hypothetical protein